MSKFFRVAAAVATAHSSAKALETAREIKPVVTAASPDNVLTFCLCFQTCFVNYLADVFGFFWVMREAALAANFIIRA